MTRREMTPTRRTLLGGALAGAGLASLPTGTTASASGFDPASWDSVRDQFALTRRHKQFTAYYLASHPGPVAAAIARHRRALDRDTAVYISDWDARDAEVRKAAADFMGGAAEDVALTGSTTMGLGLLYAGLRLAPGQEVVTTEHDFYSTYEALRLRAERDGVVVRTVRLFDDPSRASADEIVSGLRAAVTDRTRVVALTWVHSSTGVKLPIREIADMLADRSRGRDEKDRVLLCVDAVHGFGAEDARPVDLGCDFFVSGTHKWLFGPRGTGVVWGRKPAWAYVNPTIPSFCLPALLGWWSRQPPKGDPAVLMSPGGFQDYEHRWALPEAFAFHRAIGTARIAARVREQATRLKDGLARMPHVRLYTPRDPRLSAGLVCCAVEGQEPDAVVKRLLDEYGIVASTTPYRESYVRFGPSIVTTPREVDDVLRAMARLK